MNIVITGGSSGLGKLVKEMFLSRGDNVLTLSRDPGADGIACDLSKPEEIDRAFEEIEKRLGHIDLLINNAGFGISGATELISREASHNIMDVNFFGALECIKKSLPLMKSGARIVNISSACALFPLPFRSLYCASKAALSLMSNSIKMELAPAGIDVTSICPGDTKTNFTKARQKSFVTNERYGERIKNATEKIDKNENKRMPAEKVAKKIFKIATKNKTKPQYIIGAKYKLLYFASRIFPLSWLVKLTQKFYGGEK